jgi:IS1 family transposase
MNAGAGDCWTWTAIDADTKLIISYMLGDRGIRTAMAFMQDLAKRTVNRFQLTTEDRIDLYSLARRSNIVLPPLRK